MAAELRDIATTERAINKRYGRLYIDAGQNGRGKTVVAPYSLRAVEAASFSAPLKWSEVTRRLDPSRFNLKTVRKRLDAVGDLFAPVLTTEAEAAVSAYDARASAKKDSAHSGGLPSLG